MDQKTPRAALKEKELSDIIKSQGAGQLRDLANELHVSTGSIKRYALDLGYTVAKPEEAGVKAFGPKARRFYVFASANGLTRYFKKNGY